MIRCRRWRSNFFYITPTSYFNGRDWLPSPPNPGLPQTGTDEQWYHWWCELDQLWSQFTGPANINVTMAFGLPNLTVTTAAYGQAVVDPYVGPTVFMDDLQMIPPSVPADGLSASRGTLTVIPEGRPRMWSIEGDALGCTIDPTNGFITVGTTVGQITVRVADSADETYFREVVLVLTQPEE